jgi:hypothetical protein
MEKQNYTLLRYVYQESALSTKMFNKIIIHIIHHAYNHFSLCKERNLFLFNMIFIFYFMFFCACTAPPSTKKGKMYMYVGSQLSLLRWLLILCRIKNKTYISQQLTTLYKPRWCWMWYIVLEIKTHFESILKKTKVEESLEPKYLTDMDICKAFVLC